MEGKILFDFQTCFVWLIQLVKVKTELCLDLRAAWDILLFISLIRNLKNVQLM